MALTTTTADLLWALPGGSKPLTEQQLSDELLAAETRFLERTHREATVLYVAPGELVEAEGLRVVESRQVRPRNWLLSAEG